MFARLLPGPFYDCLRIGLHQSRLSLTEAMSYTLPVPRFLYVVVTVKSIPGTLRVVKRFGMKNFQRFFCLYGSTPNARGRHSEPLRPEWRDVEPLIAKLDAIPETCNIWSRSSVARTSMCITVLPDSIPITTATCAAMVSTKYSARQRR